MTIDEIENAFRGLEQRVINIEGNVVQGITLLHNAVSTISATHAQLATDVASAIRDTSNAIDDLKAGNVVAAIADVPKSFEDFKTDLDDLKYVVGELQSRVLGR